MFVNDCVRDEDFSNVACSVCFVEEMYGVAAEFRVRGDKVDFFRAFFFCSCHDLYSCATCAYHVVNEEDNIVEDLSNNSYGFYNAWSCVVASFVSYNVI